MSLKEGQRGTWARRMFPTCAKGDEVKVYRLKIPFNALDPSGQ